MNILYILAAILMLGIMVTVHEAGHFFAARLTGIPVKEFAIGFGPKILSWKSKKHETRFFWRIIPAGGYCMFYGEDDVEGKEAKTDPRAFGNYAVWKRIVTVLFGPVMNFVLALIVAACLFGMVGEDTQGRIVDYPQVVTVDASGPAGEAGILPGDRLTSVNGEDAFGVTEDGAQLVVSTLIDRYGSETELMTLEVKRGEESLTFALTPRYDQSLNRYLIGVTLNTAYEPGYTPVSIPRAFQLGASYCVTAGGAILRSLKDLITTGAGLDQTSGPVGIVTMIAEETQRSAESSWQSAFITYGELLVLISVNLGLFNLLLIPGLDGSRILFLIVEGIRRKPVPQKVEAYVHLTGYVLLFGLMIVMTYKDIINIFK
ncbi:MAG: site-2 protease family protein [Clostridia bacterium]|nr:site-2 protease family protein [Clostridia bacterium]